MKMYLISDNIDTWTGMRLAGVEGAVVHGKEELNEVRLNHRQPLFVEIPDRHGTGRKPDFITAYVNEAIGLKL